MQTNAMNEALAKILAIPMLMIVTGIALGLFLFIFLIWMLIDCLDNEKEYKTAWVITILFLGPIGAILYHRIAKKKKWLVNTIFIGGILISGVIILTLAYLGRYRITNDHVKKTNVANNYRNQQASIKPTNNKLLPVLNLPYNFITNQNQKKNNIYQPKPATAKRIYRTQNTINRYTTPKNYIA